MTKKIAIHILILLSSVLLTYFWINDQTLSLYSLQLTAFLLLTLIASHHLHRPSQFRLVESTVSTICVLLVISATGGVNSPLFFLNFILLFELALLLEPAVSLVLSGGLFLFYLFTHQAGSSPLSLAALLSFPFMTPLAYFFGKIYFRQVNQKKEIRNLHKEIRKIKEELTEDELKLNRAL